MVSVPRLFIAVPVAPAVRAAIAALPREDTVSFRWVAPEQYHITLKFLGDVDEADVTTVHEGVEEAVAAGPVRAFSLAAQGIGAFPNSRQPRVVWVGVAGSLTSMHNLQTRIENSLAARGFPRERRPFRPHITIARARSDAPFPAPLKPHAAAEFGQWQVQRIHVMESQLSPSGPRYTIRGKIALEPAPPPEN